MNKVRAAATSNSVTRVGIAPNTRNISSEMTPVAVTKFARYSR
jgi:hypothetical protein